jgi:hypothetical protein
VTRVRPLFAATAVTLALAPAGCTPRGSAVRSTSFGGEKTTVPVADVPVKGFSVDISSRGEPRSGELLAVNPCFVYVLDEKQTIAVPLATVEAVNVELYPSHAGAVAGLTALGTASTLSHGMFLIFTAPVWLAVGIPSSVSLADRNDFDLHRSEAPMLFQYARFPQGLPARWPIAKVDPGAPAVCPRDARVPEPVPVPRPAPGPAAPPAEPPPPGDAEPPPPPMDTEPADGESGPPT